MFFASWAASFCSVYINTQAFPGGSGQGVAPSSFAREQLHSSTTSLEVVGVEVEGGKLPFGEGEVAFFSAKRWDRRNRADLIESATPCHDAQVVGPYRDSNPLRLTILAAMSEDYTTAPQHHNPFGAAGRFTGDFEGFFSGDFFGDAFLGLCTPVARS